MHLIEKLYRDTIVPCLRCVCGVCVSVCLSVCLSACLSVCLSVSVCVRHCYIILYSYAPEATKCLERKREITLKLESKIEAGIER